MKKNNSFLYLKSDLSILTAINIGGVLEWFVIGMFVSWQFLIQPDSGGLELSIAESINASVVLALAATAVASGAARALGGWFFGRIGDLQGRRSAFPLTILIATLPSWSLFILSFAFSSSQWITYAGSIFVFVKFFQGVPAGGEIPGAICYLAENNPFSGGKAAWTYRRYRCSYAMFGAQIGLALSTLVCLGLKFLFPLNVLLSDGWRFVFLCLGIMGLGGFIVREKLKETDAFSKVQAHHKVALTPIRSVFSKYRKRVVFAFLFSVFEVISFSVMSTLPFYYSKGSFNFSVGKTIFMSLWSSVFCIFFIPLIGHLASKHIKFHWLKVSAFGVILLTPFFYLALSQGSFPVSFAINIALIFLFSIQASILPSILAELFPLRVRYTGIAFSFNICDGILWPIVTGISFWLISNNNLLFVLFLPIGAIFFLSTLWLKGKKGRISERLR
jgi:MHS family proline/betaine transporter-like MFS transporter